HHHLGTVAEDAGKLQAFLRSTGPSVGLTLDTGHAALGGIDTLQLVREHPGRIAHVHCKDVRRDVFERVSRHNDSFLDGVLAGMFTAPGDGDLDFVALMQALAGIGYSGWLVVEAEQDPAKADPRAYSAIGIETLRAAAARAGLQCAGRCASGRTHPPRTARCLRSRRQAPAGATSALPWCGWKRAAGIRAVPRAARPASYWCREAPTSRLATSVSRRSAAARHRSRTGHQGRSTLRPACPTR